MRCRKEYLGLLTAASLIMASCTPSVQYDGALYLQEARLYSRLEAYDLSLSMAQKSAALAEGSADTLLLFNTLVCQAGIYFKRGEGGKCDSCLCVASRLESSGNIHGAERRTFRRLQCERAAQRNLESGQAAKALAHLQALASVEPCKTDPDYYLLLIQALSATQQYQQARLAAGQYRQITHAQITENTLRQLKIAGEREWLRRRNGRLWQMLTVCVFVALITTFIVGNAFRKQSRRETQLKKTYEHLRAEYEQIKNLPMLISDLPESSQQRITSKIRAIGHFFSNPLPSSLDLIANQLESLTQNRKELLETIGLLYATYRPHFVSRLLDYHLTSLEVGYCCLLVAGLRTGELKDVINQTGVYNINVGIRKKLRLDANTSTLSAFLKNIYAQTEP